jgi:hypothetical protein
MPDLKEIKLQGPTFAHDRFFVERRGLLFQTWSLELISGMEVEFYLESEKAWIKGTVHKWTIDDASGNCPEDDAHYFLVVRRDGKAYKYDLHEDLLLQMEVPTDEELIARSGWCEGGDYYDRGPFMQEGYEHCHERGTRYIAPAGQHCWYCDKHKPAWLQMSA